MTLIERWSHGNLVKGHLETIRVLVTTEARCNLACQHCYWSHNIIPNNNNDWRRQVAQIKKMDTPVFFVGRILNKRGATFLRELLAQQATEWLGVVDNGLTILDYPEFFAHWKSVNISIDGWRDQHDLQRGCGGLFEKAWNSVMELRENGVDPIISSALSPITTGNWEKFEEHLVKYNVPMSSTLVWDLPEPSKRGRAVFSSDTFLREAFLKLVNGMPKLINIYSIEQVRVLKDILAQYRWSMDDEGGDCLKAVLPSGTIIVYRPISLVSVAEVSLHWDGVFYTPPTYGLEKPIELVDGPFFRRINQLNFEELLVWSEITHLLKKGGD